MNESITALNNQKPRDVFGQYRDGVLDAIIPERQRVQDAPCPACAKFFEEFDKDTTDEGFDFFVTLDHVLQFRDSCQFCRLLFEALCLENNDPMKASAVADHAQEDVGNSLAEWAKPLPVEDRVSRISLSGPSVPWRRARPLWPFGHRNPKATPSTAENFDQASGRQALVSALSRLQLKMENFRHTTANSIPLPVWIIIQCLGRSHVDHDVLNVDVYGFGRALNASMTLLAQFPLRAISNINRGAPDGNLRYGHILDRRIDLQHCREWVHHCGERHGDECDAPEWSRRLREQPSVPIRVVDVMDECIVEMNNRNFKYVALSYVNGDFFGTTFSNATIARLMEPRGLQKGRIAPGQTLLDAMEVTKALGVKYLWVDRLCILHDKNDDIKNQILQMDVIYGSAFVTIVAADGNNANSGLDGVSNDRAVSDLSVQVKENLSFLVPVNKIPSNNLWESRAWTYQEMLLSKRLLIFSGGQVYFQCKRGILLESTNATDARSMITPLERLDLPASRPSPILPILKLLDGGTGRRLSPDFETYAYLVTQYTKRSMSFPEDGIRAITGLLNLLEPNPETNSMLFGLPKHFMDLALMWQPATGNDVQLERKSEFPSWSWAGWKAVPGSRGGVRYEKPYRVFTYDSGALRKVKPRKGEGEIRLRPLIDWERALLSGNSIQRTRAQHLPQSGSSLAPPDPNVLQSDGHTRLRPGEAATSPTAPTSSSEIPPPPITPPPPVPPSSRPQAPARPRPRVPKPSTLVIHGKGGSKTSSETSRSGIAQARPKEVRDQTLCNNPGVLQNPHLIFETETVFLTLGTTSKPCEEILWAESEGHLVQDSVETIHETPILHNEVEVGRVILHDPKDGLIGSVHEFAKISEAQYFGDEDRVDVDGYPLFNVMLIKRENSPDIATRVGLGRVYKWAWDDARPTRTLLILG